MERWPPDFAATVREHLHAVSAWIVASSGDCLDVQAKEVTRINRALKAIHESDLRAGTRPATRSWLVAVLLCPGDRLEHVVAWGKSLDEADLPRVRLYVLPGVNLVESLSSWYGAGLPDPATADVDDWGSFHKRFGLDLNNQAYRDCRVP